MAFDPNNFSLETNWSPKVTMCRFRDDAPPLLASTSAGHIAHSVDDGVVKHTAMPIHGNSVTFDSNMAAEYYVLAMAHQYVSAVMRGEQVAQEPTSFAVTIKFIVAEDDAEAAKQQVLSCLDNSDMLQDNRTIPRWDVVSSEPISEPK